MGNTIDVDNISADVVLEADGYVINPAYSSVGDFLAYDGHAYIPTPAVTSVATNSTLTGGTITTTGTIGINLSNANTWTGQQTFNNTTQFDGYITTSSYIKTTATTVLPPSGQWINVTFQNGYSNQPGYQSVQYMKDAMGFIHLRGGAAGGSGGAAVFTLPTGYRPSNVLVYVAFIDNASGVLNIQSNGSVQSFGSGGTTDMWFDGITFYAEE
jgi:hypothetical protein